MSPLLIAASAASAASAPALLAKAQAIIRASRQLWLAADHSKFNRPAMVEVGRLDQVDQLFTDRAPPPPFAALLAEAGVACTLASSAAPGAVIDNGDTP